MIKNRPAPRWLVAFTAVVILCAFVGAGYIGWLVYQTRNTTPFERDSDQYNGWMYAEANKFNDVRECENNLGWAILGIRTSAEFVAGCREAVTAKN